MFQLEQQAKKKNFFFPTYHVLCYQTANFLIEIPIHRWQGRTTPLKQDIYILASLNHTQIMNEVGVLSTHKIGNVKRW